MLQSVVGLSSRLLRGAAGRGRAGTARARTREFGGLSGSPASLTCGGRAGKLSARCAGPDSQIFLLAVGSLRFFAPCFAPQAGVGGGGGRRTGGKGGLPGEPIGRTPPPGAGWTIQRPPRVSRPPSPRCRIRARCPSGSARRTPRRRPGRCRWQVPPRSRFLSACLPPPPPAAASACRRPRGLRACNDLPLFRFWRSLAVSSRL